MSRLSRDEAAIVDLAFEPVARQLGHADAYPEQLVDTPAVSGHASALARSSSRRAAPAALHKRLAGGSGDRPLLGQNGATPSSSSNSLTCRVTEGCPRWRTWAAPVMLPASATVNQCGQLLEIDRRLQWDGWVASHVTG